MITSPIPTLAPEVDKLLASLRIAHLAHSTGALAVASPITGEIVAHVRQTDTVEARQAIDVAHAAFLVWRDVPPPHRGELVHLLGEELRAHKEALGRLVSIEVGKILSEGVGEVQEMIDICSVVVGLASRHHCLKKARQS